MKTKRDEERDEHESPTKRTKFQTPFTIPLEIVQHHIVPFLRREELSAFSSTCKSYYELYKSLESRTITALRLFYLNQTVENLRSDTLEIDDLPNPIPSQGRLITLLGHSETSKQFLAGESCQFVETMSKHTADSFQKLLMDHLAGKQSKHSFTDVLLPILFDWNRENPQQPQFVIAGGCLTSLMANAKAHYSDSDVDIFIAENGCRPSQVHNVLKSTLLKFEEEAKKLNVEYGLIKNSGTLTISPRGSSDMKVQFILRRVTSVEELMIFFDMDCCRFAYDGEQLYTIKEGIRSIELRTNILPVEHRINTLYTARAIKYGNRGIQSHFGMLHPLDYIYNLKQMKAMMPESIQFAKSSRSTNYFQDGMYDATVVLNYSDINRICTAGLETFIEQQEEDDTYGEYGYTSSAVWRSFNKRNKEDPHVFSTSFRYLFNKDLSRYFKEGYFESHLRKKYFIFKCYCCAKYEHLPELVGHTCGLDGWDEDEEDRYTWVDLKFPEYHMCENCTEFNRAKREEKRDLTGTIAVVTGVRIKIGFSIALKLLRNGATVVGTTRFVSYYRLAQVILTTHTDQVKDALKRFSNEKDWDTFHDRLVLYPLNLKDGKSVLAFVEYLQKKYPRIHYLINNAAQTVRRPLPYYRSLLVSELESIGVKVEEPAKLIPKASRHKKSVEISAPPVPVYNADMDKIAKIEDPLLKAQHLALHSTTTAGLMKEDLDLSSKFFPPHKLDEFGEQLDRRKHHSWNYKLHEVEDTELLEVQMINQIAPTMLVAKLFDQMKATEKSFETAYIINVTSHEGAFHATGKTDNHVHTNISKAALNMLTRSAANYAAKNGVIMVSCDTGWVSSAIETHKEPPLTCEDGAARVLRPIMAHSLEYGILEKNYKKMPW